jgi:hypothetical protein
VEEIRVLKFAGVDHVVTTPWLKKGYDSDKRSNF